MPLFIYIFMSFIFQSIVLSSISRLSHRGYKYGIYCNSVFFHISFIVSLIHFNLVNLWLILLAFLNPVYLIFTNMSSVYSPLCVYFNMPQFPYGFIFSSSASFLSPRSSSCTSFCGTLYFPPELSVALLRASSRCSIKFCQFLAIYLVLISNILVVTCYCEDFFFSAICIHFPFPLLSCTILYGACSCLFIAHL